MNGQTAVLALLSLSVYQIASATVPDYIHVCRRSDPEVEQCILNSIEYLRPKLKTGLPELEVPAMEPLVLPVLNVVQGEGGLTIVGRDVKVYGPSDFRINKLKLETPSESRIIINLDLTLPYLEFDGNFDVNAQFLVLPLKGNGNIRVNATDTKADLVIHAHIYKKGNHNYIRFNKIEMALDIGDYSVRLDNLFGGDRVLVQAVNQALSENKKEFMRSANPVIVRVASELILEIANKIAKNQRYDELFPY